MSDPKITEDLIFEHGLTLEEYQKVLDTLKRVPTFTELGIISVMWSEHASYKNSIYYLKQLPREGDNLLTKTGEENAGVVDIGDNLGISFKIESHNHPSALEPYHGAATGVGGILRDIFTMGARPIAALNSLRFGNPSSNFVKHLIKGVVEGIADYGNCFGVPTVGGEVYFEDSYEGNPLVNAMAVGLLQNDKITTSAAKGVGNYVVYVGSETGKDGIHGATFASVELTEESEEKRTAVQVGDPFMEKLLLEATLEVIDKKLIEGIQDMGAAGLTCSCCEMAAKGGNGIELEISLVPKREEHMSTYEVMLSESQERMLMIVRPENFEKVCRIFEKWDIHAVKIGVVTDDGLIRIKENNILKAVLPADMLVLGGSAPVYKRDFKKPLYIEEVQSFKNESVSEPSNYNEVLLKLIASPNIASKKRVFSQYDHMVQVGTVVEPGSDAAVVRVRNTDKAISMTTDCNGRYCYLDPYEGTKGAVAEAARNIVCSGAKPLAITNCLNFGNPYKPEVYWTFVEAIRGMSDACRKFQTPVTGGNVSFYNENPKGAIYPTPTIGMIGLMENYKNHLTSFFKEEGDMIILLGDNCNEIGGSEYLKTIHNRVAGKPPYVDLDKEKLLYDLVLELNQHKIVKSAHDCSDGGLAVALAESCFNPSKILGVKVFYKMKHRPDSELFGESHSRIIISINPDHLGVFESINQKFKQNYFILGKVTKDVFCINDLINCKSIDLYNTWINALKF